jgi:hypothetical protein
MTSLHAVTAWVLDSSSWLTLKWGENSSQFLLPVVSMVPRNVLQLLLSEKYEIAKNSTTTIDKEKISTDLESLEF